MSKKPVRRQESLAIALERDRPEDMAIVAYLKSKAKERRKLRTIRDAMQLYMALERGDMSELEKQFPHVVRQISDDAQNESFEKLAAALAGSSGAPRRHAEIDMPTLAVSEATVEKGKAAANLAKGMMGFRI